MASNLFVRFPTLVQSTPPLAPRALPDGVERPSGRASFSGEKLQMWCDGLNFNSSMLLSHNQNPSASDRLVLLGFANSLAQKVRKWPSLHQ